MELHFLPLPELGHNTSSHPEDPEQKLQFILDEEDVVQQDKEL